MSKDICCPKFDPKRWEGKTHKRTKKPFIMESIPTFFHIPFPPMIGWKTTKMCKMMEDAHKAEKNPSDALLLFRDPSAFRSEIYLSVTGRVPQAKNVTISGNFISKTYAGPYNAVPKFIKNMNNYLVKQGKKIPKNDEYYIHYTYCPKCAKKYGKNYMIIFAKI